MPEATAFTSLLPSVVMLWWLYLHKAAALPGEREAATLRHTDGHQQTEVPHLDAEETASTNSKNTPARNGKSLQEPTNPGEGGKYFLSGMI